jgi:hypothetical protein
MSKSTVPVREAEPTIPKNIVPAAAALERVDLPLPSAAGYHVVQAVANALGRTYLGIAFHPEGRARTGKAALYSCRLGKNGVTDWREHWQMPLTSRYIEEGGHSRLIALEFGFSALVAGPDGLLAAFVDRTASRLLVLRDGDRVDVEANPPVQATERAPFRYLAQTADEVFASPAGSQRNAGVKLYRRKLDGSRGATDWNQLTPPVESDGRHVSCLLSNSGRLFVGLACPARGFELWAYDPSRPPNSQWQSLLDLGALRYSANAALTAIAPDGNGGLWLGTAGGEGGPVGDEGAEILYLNASGKWEVAVGEARFSPDGLKLPTSCCGPGVDDHSFTRVRGLHVKEASLFATLTGAVSASAPRPVTRSIVCSTPGGTINRIAPLELSGTPGPVSVEVRGFIDSDDGPVAFGTQFDDVRAMASAPAWWRARPAGS